MKESKVRAIILACIVIFIAFLVGTSVLGMFMSPQNGDQKRDSKKQGVTAENSKRPSHRAEETKQSESSKQASGSENADAKQERELVLNGAHRPVEQKTAPTRLVEMPVQPVAPQVPAAPIAPEVPQKPETPAPAPQIAYTVRHLDQQGAVIATQTKYGVLGEQVTVVADDLFAKGYERFDAAEKSLTLGKGANEVSFRYGKARELMSLEDFVKQEVNYDYPLTYRNIDFRGRQKDLEDFVIKKIYQGDRTTGVFYGTQDQGEQVRRTMLNGSLQGGYTRYAIDIVPLTPKHVEGDKYAIEIDLRYFEGLDYIKEGEKKVTEFYNTYAKLNLSDIEKAKLVHDWVLTNIKLFTPPNNRPEWFYNTKGLRRVHFPASAMLDGEGVCLTYAMTYARLAERLGLDVRVVQGYFGTQKRSYDRAKEMLADPDTTTYRAEYFNHSWNLVKVDGQWYHVDPFHEINMLGTLPDSPYHYFLRSDDFMSHSQVTVKHPRYPARKMDVYKAWNVNRMHPAPESRNEEAHRLPNRLR